MISPELVSARCRGGKLLPFFVNPGNPVLQELSGRLIAVFEDAVRSHLRQGELSEQLAPHINGAPDPRLARALQKLLEERCRFSLEESRQDYPRERACIFSAAASLLQGNEELGGPDEFRGRVLEACGVDTSSFYGDLPENNAIVSFEPPMAEALLERYNTALVQAILLGAEKLSLRISSSNPARQRRLFSYLRFFRLLVTASATDDGGMLLVVDGPASILEQSRRYGLQLATFFPAVCTLDRWSMHAEVLWKGQTVSLDLDETCGLKCPYHQFSALFPQEIELFRKNFEADLPGWKLLDNQPPVRGKGSEMIIPDISFMPEKSRKVFHLELFNRWHRREMLKRLAWMEKQHRVNFLIGVDRSLAENPETAQLLEKSRCFSEAGFLYRDYPTPRQLKKALENWKSARKSDT